MPIERLFQGFGCDPDRITILVDVYERARGALGLSDRIDAMTTMVAQAVMSVVNGGVRDADQACRLTLAMLTD
jgi:hypothetical protein